MIIIKLLKFLKMKSKCSSKLRKKNNLVFIFLIINVLIVLIPVTSFKIKSSANNMESKGLMEMFNNLFSEVSSNTNINLDENKINKEKIEIESSKIPPPPALAIKDAVPLTPPLSSTKKDTIIVREENEYKEKFFKKVNRWLTAKNKILLDVIHKGYLKIHFEHLQDQVKFPLVNMHNGDTLSLPLDEQGFLRNPSLIVKSNPNEQGSDLFFFFRLSQTNLYFTINEKELHIMGALNLKLLQSVEPYDDYGDQSLCFQLKDRDQKNWKLCALTITSKNHWVCVLNTVIGNKSNRCKQKEMDVKPDEIVVKINKPLIVVPYESRHCNDNWNYNQNGKDWECECSEGKEQAPIDLPNPKEAVDSLIKPVFEYVHVQAKVLETSLDKMLTEGENMKIIYRENVLRILHTNFGRAITFDGTIYQAEEIQFHTPSDHTIEGKSFDMEMQILHYGITKGDIGKQFILCILFKSKAGVYNQFLNDLDVFNLPSVFSPQTDILNNIYIPKVFYNTADSAKSEDINHLRPFSFYTYQGSLTTPPCAEDTIMIVSDRVQTMSHNSLNLFKEAIRGKDGVDSNSREVQQRNGRPVFYFDCGKYCVEPEEEKTEKVEGHFEKIKRKAIEYFYVTGDAPSGLPDSFVVGADEANNKIVN